MTKISNSDSPGLNEFMAMLAFNNKSCPSQESKRKFARFEPLWLQSQPSLSQDLWIAGLKYWGIPLLLFLNYCIIIFTLVPLSVSECPPLPTTVMDGGMIELKTLRVPFDRTHFHYDCVWQLKVPEGISGLRVFVRITSMDLSEGEGLFCNLNNMCGKFQLSLIVLTCVMYC